MSHDMSHERFLWLRGLRFGKAASRRRYHRGLRARMAVKDDAKKIGIKLFHDVVGRAVSESRSPILEYSGGGAILWRVVGRRDALLQQLTKDLRSVEGAAASVGTGDDRAGR